MAAGTSKASTESSGNFLPMGDLAEIWLSIADQKFTDSLIAGCGSMNTQNNISVSFQNAVYRFAEVLVVASGLGMFNFESLSKPELYFIQSNVDAELTQYASYLAYFRNLFPPRLSQELGGYLHHIEKALEKPAEPPSNLKISWKFIIAIGRAITAIYSHMSPEDRDSIPPAKYRYIIENEDEENEEQMINQLKANPICLSLLPEQNLPSEEEPEVFRNSLEKWIHGNPETFPHMWLNFDLPATFPSDELVEIWNQNCGEICASLLDEDLMVREEAINFFTLLFYGKLFDGIPKMGKSNSIYCLNNRTERCCAFIIHTNANDFSDPISIQSLTSFGALIVWLFEFLSGNVNINQYEFVDHPIYIKRDDEYTDILLLFSCNIPSELVIPIFSIFQERIDPKDEYELRLFCITDADEIQEYEWEPREVDLFKIVSRVFVPAFQNVEEIFDDPEEALSVLINNLIE